MLDCNIVSSKIRRPWGATAARTTFKIATAFSSFQSWITRDSR